MPQPRSNSGTFLPVLGNALESKTRTVRFTQRQGQVFESKEFKAKWGDRSAYIRAAVQAAMERDGIL